MRIGLIRHGETEWNRIGLYQGTSDVPLNETGELQARRNAPLLRGQGWARLYTSPLRRTRTTAGYIATELGLGEPIPLPAFIERSFGEFEGKSVFNEDGSRRRPEHPSIEPKDAVLARALTALHEVAAGAGDALIVTHGTVVRLLLSELLTVPAPPVTNLSLSILSVTPAGLRPDTVNGYPVAAGLVRASVNAVAQGV